MRFALQHCVQVLINQQQIHTHTRTHAHTRTHVRTHMHARTHLLSLSHTHTNSLPLAHTHTSKNHCASKSAISSIKKRDNVSIYFKICDCTNKQCFFSKKSNTSGRVLSKCSCMACRVHIHEHVIYKKNPLDHVTPEQNGTIYSNSKQGMHPSLTLTVTVHTVKCTYTHARNTHTRARTHAHTHTPTHTHLSCKLQQCLQLLTGSS